MKNKKTLSPLLTVLGAFVLSGAAMLVTLMLQQGSIVKTLSYCLESPILLVLNWLPMAALLGLFYCLTQNLFCSAGITTLVWGLLSYVNLVKVDARGDPFVPGDLLLLFEGIEAVGSYELELHPGKLVLLLVLSAGLIALGLFVRSPKLKNLHRALLAVVIAAVFVGSMAGLYGNNDLYAGLPGPDRSNVPEVFDSFGFPYVFLHNFDLYPVDEPEEYDEDLAQTWEETWKQELTTPETAPNIIMIMCEAFTDLPNDPAFTYSAEENPIAFYNALASRDDTISGHLIVSNTGAGTANTEFDVLTGMMTNRLGQGTTSAFRVVHRNTDSVPRALSAVGYRTFFLHPGDNWFYNRESVYSYLGITDHVFEDSFGPESYKGNWISDDAFLDVLLRSLEEREADTPLFTYAVTIQNHQAYTTAKYGFLPEAVRTDAPISEATAETLAVYFEGLRDSDAMLEELVAYLQQQEEPYLLVFFGDHQPNLGSDYKAYRELGIYGGSTDVESTLGLYSVPFLIWGNDAYHESQSLSALSEELGADPVLSSHYLGALTCQAAGFEGLDGYLDFLNQLRQQLPVYSVYGSRLPDGAYTDQLPDDLEALETMRWHWQYYRLKDQDISK